MSNHQPTTCADGEQLAALRGRLEECLAAVGRLQRQQGIGGGGEVSLPLSLVAVDAAATQFLMEAGPSPGVLASTPTPPSAPLRGALLTGKPQIASYIIDKTFDDHKSLLRRRLEEANAEIERLRDGNRMLIAEARVETLEEALSALGEERDNALVALERSKAAGRALQADMGARSAGFLMWHQQVLMKLIGTFALCEEWRDWQLETFINAKAPPLSRPSPPPAVTTKAKGFPAPPQIKPQHEPLPRIASRNGTPTAMEIKTPQKQSVAHGYAEGGSSVTKAVIYPRPGKDRGIATKKRDTTEAVVIAKLAK